ncbi:MAG: hypothetical protein IKB55_02730 [Clostridia bacterium]|nr:hypothetical protein [Clostridia bacterium]
MANLLGVDVGTTSMKMVLFDDDGNILKSVSKEYTLETKGDRVEFDAEKYWQMFSQGYEEIKSEYKVDALSIDTQCETLIVTDDAGTPLYNAIVWLDNRAAVQAEKIAEKFGTKTVYEITGQPEITATWPACKLMWLRENEPSVFAGIKKIFLLEDFLLYRLTGEFITERTLQSSSLYLNIREGEWWQEMLRFIGVKETQLPRLLDSGRLIGEYDGTKVVTGVMDQVAGSVGAGVVTSEIVSEMTGTTMAIVVPTNKFPEYKEESRVPCHLNYDGNYCLLTWTPTAGIALKWFKENFCENLSFRQLDEIAEKVEPGSNGLTFMPYLCGSIIPKYNPDARGAFLGLTMEHTRAHAVRAILESVAFMLQENLEYLNVSCSEIRSMGGGAASPLWCQIKANVTGKKIVTLKSTEAACLGSAIIAGVGAGIYKSVPAACEKLIVTDKEYYPSGADYLEAYKRYLKYEEENI